MNNLRVMPFCPNHLTETLQNGMSSSVRSRAIDVGKYGGSMRLLLLLRARARSQPTVRAVLDGAARHSPLLSHSSGPVFLHYELVVAAAYLLTPVR